MNPQKGRHQPKGQVDRIRRPQRTNNPSQTKGERYEAELSHLGALVESSNDAIIGLTLDGTIVSWNPSAERLYGYSESEVQGKSISLVIPPDKSTELRHNLEKIKCGEQVGHYATQRIAKGGRRIEVSLTVSPINDDAGRITGVSWVARDITAHQEADEALRKARDVLEAQVHERTAALAAANQRLRREIAEREKADEERELLLEKLRMVNEQLVVSSADARAQAESARRRARELEATIYSIADDVFLCDAEGRIVDVNAAGLRLIGVTKKEDTLKPLADYLATLSLRFPDGRPIAKEEMAASRALRGETITGFEELARTPDTGREICLLVSAGPIRDQSGAIVGAVEIVSDISRIKELDKLKDEFISVAAHELKTPVAIMKGYAQFLLHSAADLPPTRRHMLAAMNRGAERISAIVADLLDITQLHSGQLHLSMERIDLSAMVSAVVDRSASRSIKHRLHVVRAQPAVVVGDRGRLEEVLANLLDNAIRYSPGGGEIDVALTIQDAEAVISVTDYGVGIPKEKQRSIFQQFYRAHTNTPYDYGGMGVGLYISREIVSRHGGRMWFESEEGKGSTFYLTLPLGDEQSSS